MSDPQLFELVLGTNNQKKLKEMVRLLAHLPIEVKNLQDFDNSLEVEETGTTFQENARLKATVQAQHLNAWVVGEDSGISVRALKGQPGIYSARYSGENATDETNNAKLIEQLKDLPLEKRAAWYTSHISLSDPAGNVLLDVEQTCHGQVVLEPRGSGGFGYDPHFEIPEYSMTFAELGHPVKSIISHRGKAMREFLRRLKWLSAVSPGNH